MEDEEAEWEPPNEAWAAEQRLRVVAMASAAARACSACIPIEQKAVQPAVSTSADVHASGSVAEEAAAASLAAASEQQQEQSAAALGSSHQKPDPCPVGLEHGQPAAEQKPAAATAAEPEELLQDQLPREQASAFVSSLTSAVTEQADIARGQVGRHLDSIQLPTEPAAAATEPTAVPTAAAPAAAPAIALQQRIAAVEEGLRHERQARRNLAADLGVECNARRGLAREVQQEREARHAAVAEVAALQQQEQQRTARAALAVSELQQRIARLEGERQADRQEMAGLVAAVRQRLDEGERQRQQEATAFSNFKQQLSRQMEEREQQRRQEAASLAEWLDRRLEEQRVSLAAEAERVRLGAADALAALQQRQGLLEGENASLRLELQLLRASLAEDQDQQAVDLQQLQQTAAAPMARQQAEEEAAAALLKRQRQLEQDYAALKAQLSGQQQQGSEPLGKAGGRAGTLAPGAAADGGGKPAKGRSSGSQKGGKAPAQHAQQEQQPALPKGKRKAAAAAAAMAAGLAASAAQGSRVLPATSGTSPAAHGTVQAGGEPGPAPASAALPAHMGPIAHSHLRPWVPPLRKAAGGDFKNEDARLMSNAARTAAGAPLAEGEGVEAVAYPLWRAPSSEQEPSSKQQPDRTLDAGNERQPGSEQRPPGSGQQLGGGALFFGTSRVGMDRLVRVLGFKDLLDLQQRLAAAAAAARAALPGAEAAPAAAAATVAAAEAIADEGAGSAAAAAASTPDECAAAAAASALQLFKHGSSGSAVMLRFVRTAGGDLVKQKIAVSWGSDGKLKAGRPEKMPGAAPALPGDWGLYCEAYPGSL